MANRPAFDAFEQSQPQMPERKFDAFADYRMFGFNPERAGEKSTTGESGQNEYENARRKMHERIEAKNLTNEEKTALTHLEESLLDGNLSNLQHYMRQLKGKPFAEKLMKELGNDLSNLGVSNYSRIENGNPKLTLTDNGNPPRQAVITSSEVFMYVKPVGSRRFETETTGYSGDTMKNIADQIKKKAN